MERPKGTFERPRREVTGEVVYLDEMRRLDQFPVNYDELSDMAIQMYEGMADMCRDHGARPDILDAYDEHEPVPTPLQMSCAALAEELLALKEPGSHMTSVDFVVNERPKDLAERLKGLAAGGFITSDDEQLAIPSNGEYYPVLDIKKKDSKLVGAGVRIWGWNDQKYVFIDDEDGAERKTKVLLYPSDEKMSWYELEISFSYQHATAGTFVEKVTLSVGLTPGDLRLSSDIWAAVYAETGYEGHGIERDRQYTEEDIAAFADLVADIVGDEPETVHMYIRRKLQEIANSAVTDAARDAVNRLVEASWPAQANGYLNRGKRGEKSLAEQLQDSETVDAAVEQIEKLISLHTERKEHYSEIDTMFDD